MLDIKFIRDNANDLKKAVEAKQLNPKVVDEIIRIDDERRVLMDQVQKLRTKINEHAATLKAGTQDGEKTYAALIEHHINLAVVVAYGRILPQRYLCPTAGFYQRPCLAPPSLARRSAY